MSDTFICSGCGTAHPMENCTLFDGQELCPSCLEEKTTLCDHCGDRIWRDNADYIIGYPLSKEMCYIIDTVFAA